MLNIEPVLGSVHLLDYVSVHLVDGSNSVPSWGPSTLWTVKYLNLMGFVLFVDFVKQLALVGSVHFMDWILIPHGVRPLCGFSQTVNPRGGLSALWTWILILHVVCPLCRLSQTVNPCGVRPLCGLSQTINTRGVRPLCGHEFWSLVGSVHFVDMNFDPSWGPSTLWTLSNN